MSGNWLVEKFSFSKVKCFQQCPRRFWYRYVMRMKEACSPWLLFGRGVHGGMETDNLAKLRGERLTVSQVLEAAVAEFEAETEKEGVGRELKDAFATEHLIQLEKFEAMGARAAIVPVPGTVEGGFQIELEVGDGEDSKKIPALVEGFTDVVSQRDEAGPKTVWDYKSAGRPPSLGEVATHLQLGLEAIGAGAGQAGIVTFVKGGKQKPTTKVSDAVTVSTARWEKVLAFFADGIHAIRRAVKSGDFPKCDPSSFWCSAEACDFHKLCYPEKNTNLSKFVEVKDIKPSGTLPPAEWRMSNAAKKDSEKKAG